MFTGFDHFDNCHTENFSSALLCLVLELVPEARTVFAALISEVLGSDIGEIRHVRREERLDGDGARAYQRGDISVRTTKGLAMVEVKTHDRWLPGDVIEQAAKQATSNGPVNDRVKPLGVVVLAPSGLAHRIQAEGCAAVPWPTLIGAFRRIHDPLVARAVRHWEDNVERPFGLDAPVEGFERHIHVVACLREFLCVCAGDVAFKIDRRLNLTGQDGQPIERNGWRWHGVSITLRGGDRLGFYTFVATPPGEEMWLSGNWLALILDDDPKPYTAVPADLTDLSPARLDALRVSFREMWARRPCDDGYDEARERDWDR